MGRNIDKFFLLLWKNMVLQYRKPIQTTIEIIAPVLFSILLVIIRSLVNPENHPEKIYQPFFPLPMEALANSNSSQTGHHTTHLKRYTLVYSPSNNKILDQAMLLLENTFANIKSYENARHLAAHFHDSASQTTFAGVEFDDGLKDKNTIPADVEVVLRFPGELRSAAGVILHQNNGSQSPDADEESIIDKLNRIFIQRTWKTNLLFPLYQNVGPREPTLNAGGQPGYFIEGFLSLQVMLTVSLLLSQLNVTNTTAIRSKLIQLQVPLVKMQRFPHAAWVDDPLLQALISFIGIIMMLSFVYTCINTVKVITMEKEKQLKEAMKMMGLPNWLHWTAWFIKTFLFLLISIILIVALLKVSWYSSMNYSVFTKANPFVLFLFLAIYICTTITFCFAISVFFSKANTASTIAGLFWFLSYAPFLFLQRQYDQLNLTTKILVSLCTNTAMAYGFQIILMFEGTGEGIQWDNIWDTSTPDDTFNLGIVMVMLAIDALIHLMIALYVEAVFPGEYGIPQPWYFPLTRTYWRGQTKRTASFEFHAKNPNEFFETDPKNLEIGIQIVNLRKVFGGKVAVRNVNLNIYNNQIMVLLGHNGAGKTTLMSILAGVLPPTTGTAIIDGYDVLTDVKKIRASLGFCPQHNILFDELTVSEHLYFFGKLKGMRKAQVKKEIDYYVDLLELRPKIRARASTLSGGMKRKLCVGIAMCGNSKVVMLDEPTAGMDPTARRALWEVILKQKSGRIILLTTHFMDEADLLGDRIAIMAGGELQCCGSSFFLKKKYGTGYRLIIDKSPKCKPEDVTSFLKTYLPKIEYQSNIGSELSYLLDKRDAAIFEQMLEALGTRSGNLGINSFGISLTTLEEVFMKVGADHGQEELYNTIEATPSKRKIMDCFRKKSTITNEDLFLKVVTSEPKYMTGYRLIGNQVLAMVMKRILSTVRTWLLQIVQIIVPVVFLIIAIVVSRTMNLSKDLPKRLLKLDIYGNPITIYQDTAKSDFATFYLAALNGHEAVNVSNVTSRMLRLTDKVPSTVRRKYLVGATFETRLLLGIQPITIATAWYNNNPFHTPPVALGLILDGIYKKVLGKGYRITFANYPLPFTADTKMQQLLRGSSMGFQLGFNLSFSMAFVSSFYILFYVKERTTKSKHLQYASGAKVYIFWIMSLLCDLISFIFTIVMTLLTLLAFQEEGFTSADDLGRLFLVLFYFGFTMLPMIYIASFFFEVPSSGYTRMTLFSVFTGCMAFLVIQVLSTPGLGVKYVGDGLHWGFLAIPHYSLATSVRDSYTTFSIRKICNFFIDTCRIQHKYLNADECWDLACNNGTAVIRKNCCIREQDYFKWEHPGIGRNLTYSLGIGAILFLLLLMAEYKVIVQIFGKNVCRKRQRFIEESLGDEDDDVRREKLLIHKTPLHQLQNDYSVILKDVTKYYKNTLAVNALCLGVKRFECFGLLGVNGAGKTSTFKVLSGDVAMSAGDAWIEKFSIKTELKDVQKLMGYCPQFDALLDNLTVKETLTIYALIRGIPLKKCDYIVKKLSRDFDFRRHLHKEIHKLSGGNKRKVSSAVALIGNPSIILLDEPTTGMDPSTKRNLWNALCNIRDSGTCLIFTSHSMEECEALCTRLAIMVNGSLKCLGSTQHLKSKFANGYTLTVKMKEINDQGKIDQFVMKHFPTAIQKEQHQELLTYYIVDKTIPCSKMFGILEKYKQQLGIEDYSLGQSNLEQVFLSLTKSQREEP